MLVPPLPLMYDPVARMFETERPMPPALFEICAGRGRGGARRGVRAG